MVKYKKILITQVKSSIGYREKTKNTLKALGLRRMHHTIEKKDSPAIRGMIDRIIHLLKVEEK